MKCKNFVKFLYRLSFPGCCWMSSKRNFLANSMNPFIGLLGLSQSLSFFLAGDEGGGEPFRWDMAIGDEAVDEMIGWWWPKKIVPPPPEWIARGEVRSSVENSKRLNRSQRSGVRTASGWFGGRQVSPLQISWQRMPYFADVAFGVIEHQPKE
jgi:hypothetical protein